MKRLLILVGLAVSFIAGCNKIDKNSFQISGELNNGAEKPLYFLEMTGQGLKPLDTIIIDNKGKFKFSYKLQEASIFVLLANPNDYITIIPNKQEDIIINGYFNALSSSYTIKNSKDSELLHKLNQEYINTNAILAEIKQTLHENKYSENIDQVKENLLEQYNILEIRQRSIIKKFIDTNKGSLACIIALYRLFDNHYLFSLTNDLNVYEQVYEQLNKTYPNNQHTIGLKNLIEKAKLKSQQDTIENKSKLANKK